MRLLEPILVGCWEYIGESAAGDVCWVCHYLEEIVYSDWNRIWGKPG